MSNATTLIHSIPVDPLTGAVSVPIYQTSTFVQEAPGVNRGYDYARSGNPTRATLENLVATLENGKIGAAFGSGLAAIDAVVKLLQSGDEILAVDDIYGGAFRLFTQVYEKFGIKVNYVDCTNVNNVLDAITPATKLIWLETPTNPTLKISDIRAIANLAKAHSCWLLGPFDSWLVIRGIETLHLRIKQHCQSAQQIAEFLETHPAVDKVYYPGLSSHHNHKIAKAQSKGFGGIVTFSLKNDTAQAAIQLATSTQYFKLAESLGGIKSLISHPATMTHKTIPEQKRIAAGVSNSLLRLSVGLEVAEDLIADLKQALDGILLSTQNKNFDTLTCA